MMVYQLIKKKKEKKNPMKGEAKKNQLKFVMYLNVENILNLVMSLNMNLFNSI